MKTLIFNARMVLPNKVMNDAWLVAVDSVIDDYGIGTPPEGSFDTEVDGKRHYLSPGFVDTHVHGGGGYDFRDGTQEAVLGVLRTHLQGGTTTILPTLTSLPHKKYLQCFEVFNALYSRIAHLDDIPDVAGIHMEGPYCSGAVLGAQDTRTYRDVDMAEVRTYLEHAPYIRKWTAACEREGGMSFGVFLDRKGIVASLGHSNATLHETCMAFDHGYRHVTHLYSACSSYHRKGAYREGGIVEATFLLDEMDVEMITDGVHLPPEFLQLIYKIKGADHISLITDATRWAGVDIPEGELRYNDLQQKSPVYIENGVALVADRSCFAGSIALSNRLIRTATQMAGIDLVSAVRMAALTPARVLGIDHEVGSIQRCKRANLLLFDDNIDIQQIFLAGRPLSKNE